MNDINEMPPKCQYCPYWEVCEYPWVCPDREQLETKLQPTCHATDTISRQSAIDAIVNTVSEIGLHDNSEVARYGATFRQHEIIDIIEGMPSAQPEIVMCADCQKYIDYRCRDEHANLNDWRHEDDYCSFGERREDDHETD